MTDKSTSRKTVIVIGGSEWKGHRSTDKRYAGDNRLILPKSSYRRQCLAPRCRLITSWGWAGPKGLAVRQLKWYELVQNVETVRSLSAVRVEEEGAVPVREDRDGRTTGGPVVAPAAVPVAKYGRDNC